MTLSRLQLRQLVGFDTAADLFVVGTIGTLAGNPATEFILTELIDSGADAGKFRDRWAYRNTVGVNDADRERRITIYAPASGQCTVHRAVNTTYGSGADTLEIHRFPPVMIHQAINDGLARCVTLEMVFPTVAEGAQVVDLAAVAPWVTDQKEVVTVLAFDDGTVAEGVAPRELPWSRRFEDGKLYLDPPWFLYPGEQLAVEVYKTYDPLDTDLDTTDCPEPLARAAALVELYTILGRKPGAGKDNSRFRADLDAAKARFRHFARVYGKRRPRKLGSTTPVRWGPRHWRSWRSS